MIIDFNGEFYRVPDEWIRNHDKLAKNKLLDKLILDIQTNFKSDAEVLKIVAIIKEQKNE